MERSILHNPNKKTLDDRIFDVFMIIAGLNLLARDTQRSIRTQMRAYMKYGYIPREASPKTQLLTSPEGVQIYPRAKLIKPFKAIK